MNRRDFLKKAVIFTGGTFIPTSLFAQEKLDVTDGNAINAYFTLRDPHNSPAVQRLWDKWKLLERNARAIDKALLRKDLSEETIADLIVKQKEAGEASLNAYFVWSDAIHATLLRSSLKAKCAAHSLSSA